MGICKKVYVMGSFFYNRTEFYLITIVANTSIIYQTAEYQNSS